MTSILYTGGMYCNKTKNLLERAEVSRLRNRKYKIFYPVTCSNGLTDSVYSRAGIEHEAIPIQEVTDIYSHIKNLDDVYIDEIQFLGSEEFAEEDLIHLLNYCVEKKIDVYMSGLDLDFTGEAFKITKAIMPHCDKIEKLSAVCMRCFNETARRSLRLKNGKPCSFDEEVLIERHNTEYTYIPVCPSCFNKEYKKVSKGI